ncbi:Na+/H+ antiporter subunit D [Pararhizobium sp.]|uniref:Na+/H+ antiporter subunit D n=1 Tax=Pararhizobium sp. TaxID=1977563 RepID=UPI002719D2DC|nr:Na+/H+ antiporter subunit D [Pararhizobium sp.]MDO9417309.1 Na+/H+ antiporter subunit D [Pararhizobium sp.]
MLAVVLSAAATATDLSKALVLAPVPLADWLVIAPVAWCILTGALLVMLRGVPVLQAPLAIAALLILTAMTGGLLWHVSVTGPVTMVMGRWLPPFGIAFTADLFGALMAFAASLVALAGSVFALGDIDAGHRRHGFYPLLLLLMAGVSGAFLTGDIFNLYVWFEVLLIASFGLLVLGSQRRQIDGAVKYTFLNLVATTLFLVATGYLYGLFGTLNMADIALKAEALRGGLPLMTLCGLFLLAFAMKAAAFPVNFWLPASYHTPRVTVSALFAGLLTKVGIYALIRTMVMLFPVEREEMSFLIALVAAFTMITGVLGALAQTDIRRLLGYLVVSGIGMMLAGIAIGGPGGIGGAIFYALHSIIVMTALYFTAGIAARIGGTTSIDTLSGLYRPYPLFAALSLILFLAVCGLPPFSGLWPKIMLVKASIDIGAWWLTGTMLVTSLLTTIAVGRVWLLAYWRPMPARASAPTDVVAAAPAAIPLSALLPLLALTGISIAVGVFPEMVLNAVQQAASGLNDPSAYIGSVFPGRVLP